MWVKVPPHIQERIKFWMSLILGADHGGGGGG